MNNFTKLIMLISTIVLIIGGGFSFYFTYQAQSRDGLSDYSDVIAIDGFDAVAYHTDGIAQQGKHNFQVTWAGFHWYFSTLENRQMFNENPEKYAPQFGGLDPYAMALNGTLQPATPELWQIDDTGKLYLFYSGETRKRWREDMEKYNTAANLHWERLTQQMKYKAEILKKDTQ
ncbi:YHS domain-containing (seleno)protein [Paremcibacter congregatus]|uniref:YHS domain protein n=1 Tax=Paremcibacter congregatus TaxID=2043170 RepID=A0A2G4YVS6_9PROT|nr:YHS domain-containing (seleno)protein [Paremcibacter congregatus]PHZ86425.1 hypothetical protein CRD36_00615 [Paremcibacter congregatus]QDE28479.1 hypothetical protein FIV45_14975 [Paremcibacter congregatus]